MVLWLTVGNLLSLGKIEHAVVSTVSSIIPDSIREKWRDSWKSVKKTESDALGNENVSDTVEMVSWGVERAQEQHNEEASKYLSFASSLHGLVTRDTTRSGVAPAFLPAF